MQLHGHNFTGVGGALVTFVSVIFAYFSHPIPALQNAASLFAIVVGVTTLINVFRKWNK